jgi:hypothetical protein
LNDLIAALWYQAGAGEDGSADVTKRPKRKRAAHRQLAGGFGPYLSASILHDIEEVVACILLVKI